MSATAQLTVSDRSITLGQVRTGQLQALVKRELDLRTETDLRDQYFPIDKAIDAVAGDVVLKGNSEVN